jgi:hypothetical protein
MNDLPGTGRLRGLLLGFWICLMGIPLPAQTIPDDLWEDETVGQPDSLELSRESIDQLLSKLDTESPDLARQLRQWRKDDPFRFVLEIRRIALARNPIAAKAAGRQPKSAAGETAVPVDPARQGQWRQNQEKQITEFMEWFRGAYPDKARPLQQLRKKDYEAFLNRISAVRRQFEPLMRAEKRDPELARILRKDIELQDLCGEVLGKIAAAKDKDRRTLTEQLTRVVANQFDIIVQKRRLKYADIEAKIGQMQKEVDEQKRQLDQLVQKKDQATRDRVKELLTPPDKPAKP